VHVFDTARRRTPAAALAAAAITLLAACGDGGALDANVAATVGDETVSRQKVLDAADRALKGSTKIKRDELIADHLGTQVKLVIYRKIATDKQVELTDAERKLTRDTFEEQTAGQGGLEQVAATTGIAKEDIGDIVDLVTYEKLLGQKLIKDTPVSDAELEELRKTTPNLPKFEDQTSAAHILVKEESLAKQLLAELKGGADFAALAAKNSLDPGSKDKGGDLGSQPKGTFVPEFEAALETAKPGGDVVGPVKTQFGYHLIKSNVVTAATVKENARQQAAPLIARNRLAALVRSGSEVTINSRYGTWDKDKLVVVGPNGVSSEDPSAPSGAPVDSGTSPAASQPASEPAPAPSQ